MWEIDVEANSPHEAAQQARVIQLDACNTATVFSVRPKHDVGRMPVDIDAALEYELLNIRTKEVIGAFATLDEAKSAAAYDGIPAWEVWHHNHVVSYRDP